MCEKETTRNSVTFSYENCGSAMQVCKVQSALQHNVLYVRELVDDSVVNVGGKVEFDKAPGMTRNCAAPDLFVDTYIDGEMYDIEHSTHEDGTFEVCFFSAII